MAAKISLSQQFDTYRRTIDEGYQEVQRLLSVGDYDLAVEHMEASVTNQTTTLGTLRTVLSK